MHNGVLYVGTHRRAHKADPADIAFGIYTLQHTPLISGQFSALTMARSPQPGWIALHPGGKFLYAANEVEVFEGSDGGGVSAFSIDTETSSLTLLNTQATPSRPCHCEIDNTGRYLLVATFAGGTVHVFPIAPDGRLGDAADVHRHSGSSVHPRQTKPHPHAVALDPENRFLLVPDLGLDQILVYQFDSGSGKLLPRPDRNARIKPGSGPRHIAFDKHGRFFYLVNEISATVTAFAYDSASGSSAELQTLDLLPDGFRGHRSGAEIKVHPSGRFVYVTTRSHGSSGEPPIRGLDAITWFQIEKESGMLRPQGRIASGGEVPRSFTFDANGDHLFVGNQCSGTIVSFRIDPETGTPSPSGQITATPVPVCLQFIGAR
jgi:6-phosphogluconolactonase